ncbi:alpha-mannosidase [candidate division KSB1 bacterium]|nr:alpha-mannosidase [candidate division KSB1 bacterium]
MLENMRKLYEQRIENFLKRLRESFYEDEITFQIDCYKDEPLPPFEKRTSGKYQPLQIGEIWGQNWERAWFHLQQTIPAGWRGKRVIARLNLGGESLVFSADGIPLQGLSVHTLWLNYDFRRDRFDISNSAQGGEVVDLWIEASAGQLFGLQLEVDRGTVVPKQFGQYRAKIEYASLAVFRYDVWELFLDSFVLNDLMKALPTNSVRRNRILKALNQTIDNFTDSEAGIAIARDYLKIELKKPHSASDLVTQAVGHAHLDTAWLWPIEETIRKCARTFSAQLDLIEKYPGYIFGASAAQHYAFTKTYYPGLYEKIKKQIQAGRWEVQGGMWIEADCNIVSGESLVRQILYGKIFFKDEFNIEVRNLWLPDVFGYSAALPQILKKTGIDYFVTQKLSWNQFNRFPNHTFIWRGIDGSEVLTHFPPEDNYGSDLRPSRLIFAQQNFDENADLDEFLTLFGIGDGGGGPTEEIIETGLRQYDLENCPKVIFSSAQKLLDNLNQHREKLPLWVGELYLELHRGTYTTQAYNKKMNRYMELALREVEILFSALPFQEYPVVQFDEIWKRVLLYQFHDIIPGSSVTPVYEESHREYEKLKTMIDALHQEFATQVLELDENSLTLINTLSYVYKLPVELPQSWSNYSVEHGDGQPIFCQQEADKPVLLAEIPALSSIVLKKKNKQPPKELKFDSPQFILENEFIRYEFTNAGTLKSVFDKEVEKEILMMEKPGNLLSLYEDRPANWDAWDVDIYYENQLIEQAKLISQQWISQGLVRQGIRQKFTIGNSTIFQKIYLASNSKRLDFVTEVNWQEAHKMLRVSFTVDIHIDSATYEIQYGHVRRNTHRNTSWDMARFEQVGHRFADLSDHDYGVALLNDCKYGYKILDNVLDLNLLRAPTMPDPAADRGIHTFIYSLLPHRNDMINSAVFSEAAQLNQPPALFAGFDGHFRMPFSLDTEEVVLEVIKKAERENALILRLFEPKGRKVKANLKISGPITQIFETDLMENNLNQLNLSSGNIELGFLPFEIKTIKINRI